MRNRNILFATLSADSGVMLSERVSATSINKTATVKYVLTITLVALMAISGILALATSPAKTKAAASMPSLTGEEALSYLAGEGLLSSLQTEFRKLTAFDGEEDDRFGGSVAISGDTAVVGAVLDRVENNQEQGSAYIFSRNEGGTDNWGLVKKLTASDGERNSFFGTSVAIISDTIIVGADGSDIGNNENQGAVYIFSRNEGGPDNWGETKKLVASDGATNDFFGNSVAISGDTLIVGARSDDIGDSFNQGSAYIFERNAGGVSNWGETKKLIASDGHTLSVFGASVAIDEDTVIVASPLGIVGINIFQGAAYVFERNAGGADNWGETKKLVASDGATQDFFGTSVAINDDTIIVGATGNDVGNNLNQGAAYIFERNRGGENNWGQFKKLTASDGKAEDIFGVSVIIGDDLIVVGASMGGQVITEHGSAYIFERNRGGVNNWGEVKQLVTSTRTIFDGFASSAAISGDTIIIGAPFDTLGNNEDQGSAYIFLHLNVPAPAFDFCLQDDSARNRQFYFNSQTGEYLFCDGVSAIGGFGVITRKGSTITLNHTSTDRRLAASVTTNSFGLTKGSASLQMIVTKRSYSVTDSNLGNNKCDCTNPR